MGSAAATAADRHRSLPNHCYVPLQMRRLNDKLKDIMKEQSYQRERERSFRDTSESTNARVQWWSIIQSAVMVLAGVYQIFHLRSFFRSKKVA